MQDVSKIADPVDLYQRFCTCRAALPAYGRMMPFHWYVTPRSIDIAWMPYREMLGEFASDLANDINSMTLNLHRLRAWQTLLPDLSQQEIMEAKIEFIDNLATVALGMPYAIKSRFAWAAAHLCHQANRRHEAWVDDFPDQDSLYLNEIDRFGLGWNSFRRFKRAVEPIANRQFKSQSADFRNAYNHRIAPGLVLGLSGMVVRQVKDDGKVSYGFGAREPLTPGGIAEMLVVEAEKAYRAFEAFQTLVNEQLDALFPERLAP